MAISSQIKLPPQGVQALLRDEKLSHRGGALCIATAPPHQEKPDEMAWTSGSDVS